MKHNSGEAMTFALVGLLIGAAMLWVNTGSEAQRIADMTGRPTSQIDVMREQPATSVATLVLPAAAGWGVGAILDSVSGKSGGSQDNDVRVNTEGNVTVNISGNQANTSSTRTDTRNEGSNNQ